MKKEFIHPFPEGLKKNDTNEQLWGVLLILIKKQKLKWLWYDSYSERIYIDDGSTMGVLHPKTPLKVKSFLNKWHTDEEIIRYLLKLLRSNKTISKTVGQSTENTCPKCGGLLESGAGIKMIYYSCEKCDYERNEENVWFY